MRYAYGLDGDNKHTALTTQDSLSEQSECVVPDPGNTVVLR